MHERKPAREGTHLKELISSLATEEAEPIGNVRPVESSGVVPGERTGVPWIDEAIEAFLPTAINEGWGIDEYAEDNCHHASDEFLHKLAELDIDGALIEHWDPHIEQDQRDYPYALWTCSYHWCVRLGEWLIDWTAAQFDDDAPLPAVWRGPKREWRNCS